MLNIFLLGLCFCLVFTGFNTMGQTQVRVKEWNICNDINVLFHLSHLSLHCSFYPGSRVLICRKCHSFKQPNSVQSERFSNVRIIYSFKSFMLNHNSKPLNAKIWLARFEILFLKSLLCSIQHILSLRYKSIIVSGRLQWRR